jgi:hypothetical protein
LRNRRRELGGYLNPFTPNQVLGTSAPRLPAEIPQRDGLTAADPIFIQGLRRLGWYDKVPQAFAVSAAC